MHTVTAEDALVTRWKEGLSFRPPFLLCCNLTLDPKISSPGYVQSVLCSMTCCRQAAPLLRELLDIPGIEALQFTFGQINVAPLPNADREILSAKIREAIRLHSV